MMSKKVITGTKAITRNRDVDFVSVGLPLKSMMKKLSVMKM